MDIRDRGTNDLDEQLRKILVGVGGMQANTQLELELLSMLIVIIIFATALVDTVLY